MVFNLHSVFCRLYIAAVLLVAVSMPAVARQRTFGWCQKGGVQTSISGMGGYQVTPKSMGSYPGCTVTVYLTGTLTLATLYNDNSGTAKSNSFQADATTGYWFFYSDNGRYDVLMSSASLGSVTLGDISVTDRMYADQFAGSDAGAKINAAISALPSTGGTVDATGLQGAQTAAATISINKPLRLIFGATTLTLNANPGIQVSSGAVTVEGQGWSQGNGIGSVLRAGVSGPVITGHDITQLVMRDLEIDGNSNTGTFGVFMQDGSFNSYANLHVHGFKYTGLYAPCGVCKLSDSWIESNGEGVRWGSDGSIYGNLQVESNFGPGLHVMSGGTSLSCQSCDDNQSHGIYIDGRSWAYAASTSYTYYEWMRPTSGNAGNYMFMALTTGNTGASAPTWPQTVGATVADGSITWMNVGRVGMGNDTSVIKIADSYVDDNGWTEPNGNVADNIRVECQGCHQIQVFGVYMSQASQVTYPARGLHIIGANNVIVSNLTWQGSNYAGAGTDRGGLVIENTQGGKVNGYVSTLSAVTPLQLINSSSFSVNSALVQSNGSVGTATADSYCYFIDANSSRDQLFDVQCEDYRTPAYSRGINNLGQYTSVLGYRTFNLVTNADVFGSANVLISDPVGSRIYSNQQTGSILSTGAEGYLSGNQLRLGALNGPAKISLFDNNGTTDVVNFTHSGTSNGLTINPANIAMAIGNGTPTSMFTVGTNNQFSVNGSGQVSVPQPITISGLAIAVGLGAPAGTCVTGSLYLRTDGGTATTLYVCQSAAWAAK